MRLSEGYLKLIAQKIIKHNVDWDNKNKYTGLFLIVTPVLEAYKRMEFNERINGFSFENSGLRIETAERICYNSHQPYLSGNRIVLNIRVKSESGFDVLKKVDIDVVKLERGLRDLAFWCLWEFKNICNEQGITFENDEVGISDLQAGVRAYL